MKTETSSISANTKTKDFMKKLHKQRTLVLMSIPFIVYVFIFSYLPLSGWLMAFQKYRPGKSLFDQEWCGLFQFKLLFQDETFLRVLRNTLCMSLINLTLGFVTAIGLAILINEVKSVLGKKLVQTISYLPHF